MYVKSRADFIYFTDNCALQGPWVGRIALHTENLLDLKIFSPLSYMLVQKTHTYSKACNSLSLYEGLGARVRPIWPNVFFKISFFTVTVMGDKVIHYYCTIIFWLIFWMLNCEILCPGHGVEVEAMREGEGNCCVSYINNLNFILKT